MHNSRGNSLESAPLLTIWACTFVKLVFLRPFVISLNNILMKNCPFVVFLKIELSPARLTDTHWLPYGPNIWVWLILYFLYQAWIIIWWTLVLRSGVCQPRIKVGIYNLKLNHFEPGMLHQRTINKYDIYERSCQLSEPGKNVQLNIWKKILEPQTNAC